MFVIDSDDYDWGKENPQKIYNLGLEKLLFEITSIHIAKFLYTSKRSVVVSKHKNFTAIQIPQITLIQFQNHSVGVVLCTTLITIIF